MPFRRFSRVQLSRTVALSLAAGACLALSGISSTSSAQVMPPKRDTAAIRKAIEAAGETPIPLKFTAMDGRVIDLAKLRGKVVAIEFWSLADCMGCTEEESFLKKTYDAHHAKGFEVIRIALDSKTDIKPLIEREMKENGITWPVMFDGKGMSNELVQKFGIQRLPQIFVFDKKGLLVAPNVTGFDIDSYISSMVAQ